MRAKTTQFVLTPRRVALIAALLAGAAGWTATQTLDWLIPAAQGQQVGHQIGGGAQGPSQGSVGGGHTGAANPGGAGGVPNPAAGTGAGGYGGSAGEGNSVTNTRAGYLGGRTVPDDGGDGSGGGTVTPHDVVPPTLEALASSCPHAEPVGLGPQARIAGENVARLGAVSANLNPVADLATLQSSAALLAGYQEALAGPKPDPMLAGTYLGLVAREPVTADAVRHVSASLCVPVGTDQATAIAHIAEGQRQKLEREAQARAAMRQ